MAGRVQPCAIAELALQVPREEFHNVCWRVGSSDEQSSRLATVRVQAAERHVQSAPPSDEEWLLIEWLE